ncbi:MAG: hypothetical protein KJN97_00295 [Deltaproteobacteria bacterium]|nr:hypothetical protein [Deltaproteobacteria bacterium]
MPNTSLLWILGLFFVVFYFVYTCVPIVNARGDVALQGVMDGVPLSLKTRRLILFTHYIPLSAFMAAFNLVASFGFLELARGADGHRVAALGYMVAIMGASNAVVWIGLSGAWVLHTLKAFQQAEPSYRQAD